MALSLGVMCVTAVDGKRGPQCPAFSTEPLPLFLTVNGISTPPLLGAGLWITLSTEYGRSDMTLLPKPNLKVFLRTLPTTWRPGPGQP